MDVLVFLLVVGSEKRIYFVFLYVFCMCQVWLILLS